MARAETPQEEISRLKRDLAQRESITQRLKNIVALYVGAYNTPKPVEQTAVEFMYAVGDLLEGTPLKDLALKHINMEEVLREAEDTT